MSDSATLTIRIDEELKGRLEKAAGTQDRSVTEFVVRAIKARVEPLCPRCGRSDEQGAIPAGFTKPLDDFIAARRQERNNAPVVISTFEWGRPCAYRGHLVLNVPHEGMLLLSVPTPPRGTTREVPIPRGVITGWQEESHDLHQRLISLGYIDGNVLAGNAFATRRA